MIRSATRTIDSSSDSPSARASGTNTSGEAVARARTRRCISDGARSSRAATSSTGSPARCATWPTNSLSITVQPRVPATSRATGEPPAPYCRVIVTTAIGRAA